MLDIKQLKKDAEYSLDHHWANIKKLEGFDSDQHKASALELKNTILVEVIRPLEEMILMLDLFTKMGLHNVPRSMFVKWQVRFDCLLTRMGVVE